MTKKEQEYLLNLFMIAEKWILKASEQESPEVASNAYKMAASLLEGSRQNLLENGTVLVKQAKGTAGTTKKAKKETEIEMPIMPQDKKYLN